MNKETAMSGSKCVVKTISSVQPLSNPKGSSSNLKW